MTFTDVLVRQTKFLLHSGHAHTVSMLFWKVLPLWNKPVMPLLFYHNPSANYVSISCEVGTYRGNIVFALTRPAQPKQLLPWILGWTLLRRKTSVCRITPNNKWIIIKSYLAQRTRTEAPPRCLPPAAQRRDRVSHKTVNSLFKIVETCFFHWKPDWHSQFTRWKLTTPQHVLYSH